MSHESVYVKHPEEANLEDREQTTGCQGLGEGGMGVTASG